MQAEFYTVTHLPTGTAQTLSRGEAEDEFADIPGGLAAALDGGSDAHEVAPAGDFIDTGDPLGMLDELHS